MTPKAEEYNEDELRPPQWLDGEFITKVLQNCERNAFDLELKSFKVGPATVKGDHYASVMFRSFVEYRLDGAEKSKSMIIKTMPQAEGHKKDLLEKFDIFDTEIGMYTQVLPRFEKELRDIGDNTTLKAPVLYHALSPHKLIVFEDIVPMGYNVLRERCLNEEEVKAAYAKLAKWHAISHKIIREEPHYFDKYRHSFFSEHNIKENVLFLHGMKNFMNFMRRTPELKEYLPTFEKLYEKVDLLDATISSFREYREAPRDDTYYVLNHGDFHMKNMMLKHNPDTGKFEDVMLLDYQFSHVGPITSDLKYSIFMFLDDKLRPRTAEFLHHYFTIFKQTLEKIGYDGPAPTFVRFRENLFRHRFTELMLMITLLPMWPKCCRGELSPESLMTDNEYVWQIYDKEYIDELLRIIPNYLYLGYLDV